jgi:hypothetical protein
MPQSSIKDGCSKIRQPVQETVWNDLCKSLLHKLNHQHNIMKSDRIKNWPKDERPRERLLKEGADKLTEAELLAITLRVGQGTFKQGTRGQNASDFARTLLKDFRGLRGLDRAHVEELLKVPGLGPAKVAQIKAAFELGQ